MSSEQQLEAVRALHAHDDGTLDRAALLELLAEDVEWWVLGSPERLPFAGAFRGRSAVNEWFETLNLHMAYERFDPLESFAGGDKVVEVIAASGHARESGRPFESQIVRIWTFADDHATHVRSYFDTAAYERAFGS